MGVTIVSAQRASRKQSMRRGANFTHAALYVGDGNVIDMTRADDISERSVWEYCQDREIAVRRVPHLSAQDGTDVVQAARAFLGQNLRYSVLQAVMAKLFPGVPITQARLFCSTFVGLCYATGTQGALKLDSDPDHQPLYPGTLFGHSALDPVLLEWRKFR